MGFGSAMKANEIKTAGQLIEAIRGLWDARSIRRLHEWLGELETEEDYYRLIGLADQADLYKYSNLLSTHAYKRFGTLRPFAWHCTRLLETGKSLEAEERMNGRLQGIAEETYAPEERASAHQLLLRVFCELNRLTEAKEQLEKIREAKGFVWADLEAYYYLHSGEWDKAEALLKTALAEETEVRNEFARQLYADYLAMDGRQAESLAVLREGRAKDPENWAFLMEQVKRLFHLGQYGETIRLIEEINAKNPFHVNREHYIFLTAESLYKLEKWAELEAWIAEHKDVLERTIYGKTAIRREGALKQLKLTPTVQKLDYCVPASLSMMLQAYGEKASQDDIASHIFDVTGTKLRTTMTYMESRGMKARYFKGSVDVYKTILDAGVPVLLSMMIENTAHVQVVAGYDDRLQAMIIQDPNDQSPFLMPYGEMKNAYKMSDSLSMVFLKEEQEHLLELLDEGEHRFFSGLYEFLDEEEEGESEAFIAFLKAHQEERYAAVIGISALFSERAKELHGVWLERLREDLGADDAELALLTAHMHYQKNELPQALASLEAVDERRSPYALFLRAVILMSQDRHSQAIPLLKRSIELDHYQPAAYSHLARCYMETGKLYQAFKWSGIALEQVPSDDYIQITHSLVQYETGAYEGALARFRKLSEDAPEDGYFIYEIGRCLLALGEKKEAMAAFERSVELDPALPFSYLRIAEIHMEAEKWELAEEVINQGIEGAAQTDILHVYRGHIATERDRFKEAEADYRKALELDPEDLFAVTYIAHSLVKQERFGEAVELIGQYAEKGDSAYFIRTATMLWEEWPAHAGREQAASLLEKGLENRELADYLVMAETYAEFGEDPQFLNRVLLTFKALREESRDETLLCLEGQLHEAAGNNRFARSLYEEAAEKSQHPPAFYRLGLMDEEAGEPKGAVQHFSRCVELDPGHTAAREGLMRAYTETGNRAAAFAAALHVLRHDPLEADFKELFSLAATEEAVTAIAKTLDDVAGQVPEEWLFAAKALCAEKEGRLDDAEALFGKAKAVNGAFPSRYQHVEFCIRRGQFDRAALLLEELIAERPEDERLYGEYIRALAETGKTHEISKRLKKWLGAEELAIAETHSADALALWFDEHVEEAEEARQKKGFFGKLYQKSRQLRMISTIITLYEEAAKRLPESEVPVIRLASVYLGRGMAEEAVDELAPFVKRTGNYEAAVLHLQAVLQLAEEKGSPKLQEKAVDLARGLHKEQPADAAVLIAWGDALLELGEIDKALEKFDHVLRLQPYNGEVYIRVLHILPEHRPEGIEAVAAQMPEELQFHEWVELARGRRWMMQHEAGKANGILSTLTEQEPDFLPAFYELARCQMMQGDKRGALRTLRQLFKKEDGDDFLELIAEEPLFEPAYEEIDELAEELVGTN
ncbi:tetratricopeptide repeat protein [Planococcus chinensis]|uniref:Tetratricopeptide repeat protein n=2 Tax=Planococcus chinensis TaxID=272917 RepID=A0ABW4QHI6_9BACL